VPGGSGVNSAKLTTEAMLTLKRLGAALKDERLAGYRFKLPDILTQRDLQNIIRNCLSAELMRCEIISFFNMICSQNAWKLSVLANPNLSIHQSPKMGSTGGFK
jgi:hypothetical protein